MFQFLPYKNNVFRDILFFIVFFCMVKFENLIEKKKDFTEKFTKYFI